MAEGRESDPGEPPKGGEPAEPEGSHSPDNKIPVDGFARRRGFLHPGGSGRVPQGADREYLAATTLSGDSITTDDLHGTVTLVTTWGSWCGWSRAELPWLEKVRQRLADEDVTFLNFGWDEDPEAWREAVSAYDLGGVHVRTDEAMRDAWGLVKTPTLILLDRDGSIITVDAPRPSTDEGEELEAAIRSALSGQ